VGCKVGVTEDLPSATIGFTLTMWDVKVIGNVLDEVLNVGFTLTMWDVKFFKTFAVS